MSSLRKPALGPIVGHTTERSCRLWIAAADPVSDQEKAEDRRTLGVIGVVRDGSDEVDERYAYYFRLRREYDRTGTFNLGVDVGLWKDQASKSQPFAMNPGTLYRVRLATLTVDDPHDNELNIASEDLVPRLPPASVWAKDLSLPGGPHVEAVFKTFPSTAVAAKPALSFLLGSCRYPGPLWKAKESDRVFGPMLAQHADANFVLMVGDQIYADMLNRLVPIGKADTYTEFQERYRSAFGSPNMRRLLSRLPTYMILDDHEIEDNWTQDRISRASQRELFQTAIGAYMSYQWSHGPRFEDNYVHRRTLTGDDRFLSHMDAKIQLFYDFACAGYPFFVLDTRTQRFQDERTGLNDNHLLGKPSQHPSEPSQLNRLCAWLRHQQEDRGDVPKFIVTSSVFVPNTVDSTRSEEHKDESDSWPAFPNTRRAVLDCIVENKVQNVIFLSGDIHCANIAKLGFDGKGERLTAYSVTSSAFYWPFPFADGDPSGYVHDSTSFEDGFPLSGDLGTMHYKAWAFTQADNFCRVDVDPHAHEMVVQVFGSDGEALKTRKQDDSWNSKPERLKLAPW